MKRFEDRHKRREVFCRTSSSLNTWREGKVRQNACQTELEKQPVFYVPEEGPEVRVNTSRPRGITLFNNIATFTCPETFPGSIGTPTTIAYGQYITVIAYTDIPNITDTQLFFIDGLDQTGIDTALSNGDLTPISTMRLTTAQMLFIEQEVTQALKDLADVVMAAGTGSLQCEFLNDEKSACCPEGFFMLTPKNGQCVTIPAGKLTSNISKSHANTLALDLAQASLDNCRIGNDPVTLICPASTTPQTGSVYIQENTYIEVSKDIANRLALEYAEATLFCSYCNDDIIIACPDSSITQTIVIPAGSICRESPTELSSVLTELLNDAESCQYINKLTKCSCKDLDPTYDAEHLQGFSTAVNAGEFIGDTQEEVDLLAFEECSSRLNCGWCNDIIRDPCEIDPMLIFDITIAEVVVPRCRFVSELSKEDANEEARASIDMNCPDICSEDCDCITDTEAASQMNDPEYCGLAALHCGYSGDGAGNRVKRYCIKDKDPADGGGGEPGPGPGPGPGPVPVPDPDGTCPEDCICHFSPGVLAHENPGMRVIDCPNTQDKDCDKLPDTRCYKLEPVDDDGAGDGDEPQQCPADCVCSDSQSVLEEQNPGMKIVECPDTSISTCGAYPNYGSCFKIEEPEEDYTPEDDPECDCVCSCCSEDVVVADETFI